jgi:hypothetical protein
MMGRAARRKRIAEQIALAKAAGRLDVIARLEAALERVEDEEREEGRIASRARQLDRRTHKDQDGKKHTPQQEHWWRRPKDLPEPIKQPDLTPPAGPGAELEPPPRDGLIPGTFRLLDPTRVGGIVDRPRAPRVWTGRHVGARLIEAHKVLARLPATIGPKEFGKAWPAYKHEFGEQVLQAGAGTLLFGRNAPLRGATADEVARMSEAIYWPMQFADLFLSGEAADVNAWAADTTEEEFEHDSKGAPWSALWRIAEALNAAREIVR